MREFPIKGCRECSFSSGGQYFAAVNNNSVHVYSAYTCAALAVLRWAAAWAAQGGRALALTGCANWAMVWAAGP